MVNQQVPKTLAEKGGFQRIFRELEKLQEILGNYEVS